MNTKFRKSFLLAIATIAASSLYAEADIVAHWPLDDGSGSTFEETVADNDGFLPNGSTIEWVQDGPAGIQDYSVMFHGELGPSVIETPFAGIGGANARTVTMWIKTTNPRTSALVSWGRLQENSKWHFRVDGSTEALRSEFHGGQNYATTDVADGEWHFVASVLPENAVLSGDVLHFVDGKLDTKAGGTPVQINTVVAPELGAFPVHIGWAAGHDDRYFSGQIADVRIFDEALNENQLRAIMAVPEPSSVLGMLVGGLALLRLRRRMN